MCRASAGESHDAGGGVCARWVCRSPARVPCSSPLPTSDLWAARQPHSHPARPTRRAGATVSWLPAPRVCACVSRVRAVPRLCVCAGVLSRFFVAKVLKQRGAPVRLVCVLMMSRESTFHPNQKHHHKTPAAFHRCRVRVCAESGLLDSIEGGHWTCSPDDAFFCSVQHSLSWLL